MYYYLWLIVSVFIFLYIFNQLTCIRCYCSACLVGKTALITGGNSGIGYEVALKLASRGCRVIIGARNNLGATRRKIIETTGNSNIIVKYLDLASFESIRKFAKEINESVDKLDILINNSGVGTATTPLTDDGLNMTMQVNYLGPFLLTHLLVGLLKKSAPSRIIFTSSILAFVSNLALDNLNNTANFNTKFHTLFLTYSNSKLGNVMMSNGFAEKLKGSGVTANSLHPGSVSTPIFRKIQHVTGLSPISLVFVAVALLNSKSVQDGAQTTLHLAMCRKLKDVSGKYFLDCRRFFMPWLATNKELCATIWTASEDLVKLAPNEKI